MDTELIKAIFSFKEEIKTLFALFKDEISQSLDKSLNKYVINFREKYGKTKTFLHSQERVDFDSIYFPLTLSDKKGNLKIKITTQTDELFQKNKCISIIGMAGSGKTMVLKRLFLSTLLRSYQIPIVLELRKLNYTTKNLSDYILEEIFGLDLTKNENIFSRFLRTGRFTFFFDGFDELALNNKAQRVHEIEAFIDRFPNNYYLLTSRPSIDAENLERFENLYIKPLNTKEIELFVTTQLQDQEDGEILIEKIIKTIKSTKNKSYKAFLKNPLLLSMFILTYNSYPELPAESTGKCKISGNV